MTAAREAHGISERRACAILGADRSVARYQSRRPDDACNASRLRALAAERRRFGYRRLGLLLAREGVRLNHKKLRRLYPRSGCRCAVAAGASGRSARGRR